MPEWIDLVRYMHVIGGTVLFGTGMGIAFFMVMANSSKNPALIAHVSGTVVIADALFTATAAIIQPITGTILALDAGWPLTHGWVFLSILLYVFVGMFWIPVVFIQIKLRDLAIVAEKQNAPLDEQYNKLYRIWFAFGFPAFFAVLVIFWLMLFKPDITIGLGF
jgi:uncharacterized membrane protein